LVNRVWPETHLFGSSSELRGLFEDEDEKEDEDDGNSVVSGQPLRACLKRVEQATSLCLGRNLLPKSGELVARQDGQVARSTPFQTGS
jgi:hypothetical protein